ncbi:hypothetical protein ABGV42_00945 [Paenibacillus pabuli]|uniref:hypothetical protein n=1 Tax=Paenibacillus pabuli TaxID=1472 RepID=UPI00324219CF
MDTVFDEPFLSLTISKGDETYELSEEIIKSIIFSPETSEVTSVHHNGETVHIKNIDVVVYNMIVYWSGSTEIDTVYAT